jgi:ribosomal protein L11 methyltransferase
VAWLELTLRLRAEDFPGVEALLTLAGATSIAISDDGDTPILEPAPGTTPLWPTIRARALFDAATDPQAIGGLLGPIDARDIEFKLISDAEISANAQAPISPVDIGPRLKIVPADALDRTDRRLLGLHMGLAFGTGQHPTTRLCLEWLEREMPAGIRVLDYGAGSGVLALAALQLGATHVTAIDNEPQALAAAERNARLNGLERSIRIAPPEMLEADRFDLIVANILARPLIELADDFAGRQSAGGRIVLSGILASQLDELENHYRTYYEDFARQELADWGLLTGTRSSGYDR